MHPFVVVGMPRTGSTLLSTGLDQHTDIKCFGELFHPVELERTHSHAILVDGERVFFDPERDDAIGFLKASVYCPRYAGFKAVGFKLFGEYVQGPGAQRLFQRLKEELPGLRVIHIARRNYLDILVSREVARATRQWVIFSDRPEERREIDRITIDPEMAARFFGHMREMDAFYERFFGGPAYRKVTYEELDADYQRVMDTTFAFLGLDPQPVRRRTIKQRTLGAEQIIADYDVLAERFAGTPEAAFFGRPA